MTATVTGSSAKVRQPGTTFEGQGKVTSWWEDVWLRFRRQKVSLVAAGVLLLIVASAMLAPVLSPYDPAKQFRKEGLSELGQPLPPNAKFLLGTDAMGRDLLSRLLHGGRVSLTVGAAASSVAVSLALFIGGLSGYAGGKLDFAIMRFVDFMMSVPTFFLMLLIVVILERSVWVIILVISAFAWTYPSRIFRGQVLLLKQQDFVEAARAIGAPGGRVFLRHIVPHLLPLVVVYISLGIPGTIFAEVGLSFVGLGVPPPTPSWGSMIQDGINFYRAAPWIALYPGIMIMLTVVSFNLVGNGLREAMDPTRRGR